MPAACSSVALSPRLRRRNWPCDSRAGAAPAWVDVGPACAPAIAALGPGAQGSKSFALTRLLSIAFGLQLRAATRPRHSRRALVG
jgi:hypothetical protein